MLGLDPQVAMHLLNINSNGNQSNNSSDSFI